MNNTDDRSYRRSKTIGKTLAVGYICCCTLWAAMCAGFPRSCKFGFSWDALLGELFFAALMLFPVLLVAAVVGLLTRTVRKTRKAIAAVIAIVVLSGVAVALSEARFGVEEYFFRERCAGLKPEETYWEGRAFPYGSAGMGYVEGYFVARD